MDKDLAGQDAKDLYEVSAHTCQSQQILFLFSNFLALFSTNVSLFHENGSYLRNNYDL